MEVLSYGWTSCVHKIYWEGLLCTDVRNLAGLTQGSQSNGIQNISTELKFKLRWYGRYIQNLRSIQLLLISNVVCNNDFAALWLSRIFRWQLESRCIASFGLLHSARNLKVSKSCSHKYDVTIHAIKKDSDLENNVKFALLQRQTPISFFV